MDTRRWGPGERIVFEPYDRQMFADSFEWVSERGIFPDGNMGSGRYEDAVILLPQLVTDAPGGGAALK